MSITAPSPPRVPSRDLLGSRPVLPTEFDRLTALLDRARDLESGPPDAGARQAQLRAEAVRVTADLTVAHRIPGHLRVRPDEPTVVVVRTLVAIARRLRGTARSADVSRPGRTLVA
jgi:hypothetical protein